MGGYFGAALKHDAISDVFFGTDYHSHLGTKCGGMAAFGGEVGLQREIHNIQNSLFRTKFDHVFDDMKGDSAIGCISDFDPQPLLVRSRLGRFAICFVGLINNAEQLIQDYFDDHSCQTAPLHRHSIVQRPVFHPDAARQVTSLLRVNPSR